MEANIKYTKSFITDDTFLPVLSLSLSLIFLLFTMSDHYYTHSSRYIPSLRVSENYLYTTTYRAKQNLLDMDKQIFLTDTTKFASTKDLCSVKQVGFRGTQPNGWLSVRRNNSRVTHALTSL